MGWLSKLLGADERNRRLVAWGQSVAVSPAQRRVMREIWDASKSKRAPARDPLAELSNADRAYLLKICGADFRPAEFGSADTMRIYTFKTLLDWGFTPDQAAIVIGMTFNAVGPIDL